MPGFSARSCPFASPSEQSKSAKAADAYAQGQGSLAETGQAHNMPPTAVFQAYKRMQQHRAALLRSRTAQLVAGMRAVDSVRNSK